MTQAPSFDQLVFSGGGTRCFWQGGFLDIVRRAWEREPARIASVSGGALAAAAFIGHRGHDLLDIMCAHFAWTGSNVTLGDMLDDDGLTPHQRIYREVVTELVDEKTRQAVADGPAYEVLLGHPPGDSHSKLTATAATLAYEAELHTIGAPHFDWAEKMGVTSTIVDARQAARDGRLVELICAAAVIPPIIDIHVWDGRPVIDGGMADQAPMPSGDRGRTLVALTRRYKRVPDHADRIYVWPSEETPADKIDFTDPGKIRKTWALGRRDGQAFLDSNT